MKIESDEKPILKTKPVPYATRADLDYFVINQNAKPTSFLGFSN
jgi:hypothetical protein